MKTPFKYKYRAGATCVVSQLHLCCRLILTLALVALSAGSADAAARDRSVPIPTPTSQPVSITMGPDGNFWFVEQNSSRVARITPRGVITEFVTPTFSFPNDITPGPDGNVWFSEGSNGQIAFITPGGQITEIMFSNFDASAGIVTGPDGNIWFCDLTGNNIWRYELATQVLTKFPVPTPDSFPSDIAAGADGNLWFTEETGNNIGRITPSGIITEFGDGNLGSPRSIVDGPDGNLWFSRAFDPMMGRIMPNGTITFFPIAERAEGIARGRQNNILFTEFGSNKIAQITTAGVVTESVEFPNGEPTGITAGPGQSGWFLGYQSNRVYRTTVPR